MSYEKAPSYFPLYWLLNNPHKIVYYFIPNKSPKQLVAFFSIALMNSRFSLTEHVLIQVWPAWSWHRAHLAPAKCFVCAGVWTHLRTVGDGHNGSMKPWLDNWVFPKIVGFPPNHPFYGNRVFSYKPSILGVLPLFWETPISFATLFFGQL